FLFSLGLAAGIVFRARGTIPWSRPVFIVALFMLAFGMVYSTRMFGFMPDLQSTLSPVVDVNKGILGLTRLLHFLSLAYVISQLPLTRPLLRLPGADEIVRLGRQSLSIFAAGSILSALGQIVLAYAARRGLPTPNLTFVECATVASGIILMIWLARCLERRQQGAKGTTLA